MFLLGGSKLVFGWNSCSSSRSFAETKNNKIACLSTLLAPLPRVSFGNLETKKNKKKIERIKKQIEIQ